MALKKGIYTTIRISTDTYNKLHFLKQPFETHDEELKRILGEYPEMKKQVAMLENIIIERKK